MTIKDLGRCKSLEMGQRYTRSVTFEDSLKFYKAPLGQNSVEGCAGKHLFCLGSLLMFFG